MDKYNIVLDLIEHPDKYSTQKIEEILSDHEVKTIYCLLCKTKSTFSTTDDNADVDVEWRRFSNAHTNPKFRFLRIGFRAASIATIALSSLAVVALTITFAVKKFEPIQTTVDITIDEVTSTPMVNNAMTDVVEHPPVVAAVPTVFEDVALDTILNYIARINNIEVDFKHPETARLHLFYKFDPNLPLEETIEQLNTFEQINIRITSKRIIVN
ncbi:MAG: DUF4974 domain-containing protein [Odoribacter sp.]|nr:DUF4974 domain-containing protein [Odoribacter sp.]